MPNISFLIKPASSNCNLRCKYCFYHSLAENRNIDSYGIMEESTLENLVKKALEYADEYCCFAFQGGEPTLAGLKFYRKLIELEKKFNFKNVKITHAIQTNGTLIDEEWAQFLHNNKFLVGISLDGNKETHDKNRVDAQNKGTFNRVIKTIDLFNKYEVEYNVLFVVNGYLARHTDKVYNFFKKNDFKYLQFIPCLDPLGEEPGDYPYSLKPERFKEFLINLFDRWYEDFVRGEGVSIRYFDNLVSMLMGYPPEACGMSGSCTCQFIVEADGGVYPCDFYVIDEWYLGNVNQDSLGNIQNCENAKEFIGVSRYIDPECKKCKWINICRGGCRRYREPFVDGKPVLNYFCESYKAFFEHSIDKMMHVAKILSSRR